MGQTTIESIKDSDIDDDDDNDNDDGNNNGNKSTINNDNEYDDVDRLDKYLFVHDRSSSLL